MAEHVTTQVNRAFTAYADSQKNREEFSVREVLGAEADESFAWTLVFRPVIDCHVIPFNDAC
jgi:hypothetical protein